MESVADKIPRSAFLRNFCLFVLQVKKHVQCVAGTFCLPHSYKLLANLEPLFAAFVAGIVEIWAALITSIALWEKQRVSIENIRRHGVLLLGF